MRILLAGAGGTAFARIAARRPFAELVIADYDLGRAQRAAAARDGYLAVRLDMAMSLSYPHPEDPYRQVGVKLGDEQFALAPEWEQSGKLALAGMGVEPGLCTPTTWSTTPDRWPNTAHRGRARNVRPPDAPGTVRGKRVIRSRRGSG